MRSIGRAAEAVVEDDDVVPGAALRLVDGDGVAPAGLDQGAPQMRSHGGRVRVEDDVVVVFAAPEVLAAGDLLAVLGRAPSALKESLVPGS